MLVLKVEIFLSSLSGILWFLKNSIIGPCDLRDKILNALSFFLLSKVKKVEIRQWIIAFRV